MTNEQIISWLLEGDISIRYQVKRDLLDCTAPEWQKRIEKEGWGAQFLARRHCNGHWGQGFYQPKWISTHYTLLDLKNLQLAPDNDLIRETLEMIFREEKGPDGGILPIGTIGKSDVCVNGMILNYASYFGIEPGLLESLVDFLLSEKMQDGGFNCHSNRRGAHHSSLHTTLSVLEGIWEYKKNRYTYRLKELEKASETSHEFILEHHLFLSDKTGQIIRPSFLNFYYPCRWYYDILKALDYFQMARIIYDPRMREAMEIILKKRTGEGVWKLASKHPGKTHFEMETAGKPSRWNTLRALRVLKYYLNDHCRSINEL